MTNTPEPTPFPIIRNETKRLSPTVWGAGQSVWDPDGVTPEVEFDGSGAVRFGDAPPEVAAVLGAAECCIRSRLYKVAGVYVLSSESYIPAEFARGTRIAERDTGPGGTFARLAELGHAPARFREDVTVDRGSLVSIRTAFDAPGRAVECSVIRHDQSRITLRFEWDA